MFKLQLKRTFRNLMYELKRDKNNIKTQQIKLITKIT